MPFLKFELLERTSGFFSFVNFPETDFRILRTHINEYVTIQSSDPAHGTLFPMLCTMVS